MTIRARVRFKADDIWDAPEDGNIYEVVDGDLYLTPAPAWIHQRVVARLFFFIAQHVFSNRLGEVVTAPTGVVLDEENGLQPDLVFVSNERRGIISERGVEGAPDLVVEVLSPLTRARDLGIKLRRYAVSGVPHYWTLDPIARVLEERRLTGNGYELVGAYGEHDVFRPALFPGLEIRLAELWA
ncbi:MAG: Uma2 family endonuclease [Chloroflexota bacterium]|nr:Uma2 family endonuclease [Chloroflexota bacterium]